MESVSEVLEGGLAVNSRVKRTRCSLLSMHSAAARRERVRDQPMEQSTRCLPCKRKQRYSLGAKYPTRKQT